MIRWWLPLLAAVLSSGCISTLEQQNLGHSAQDRAPLGFNLKEASTRRFQPVPQPNYFYGQLVVETHLKTDAIQGRDALRLMDYVTELFGTRQDEIGVVLTPIVGEVRLPPLVPFSYRYDQEAQTWEMHLNRKYVSPFILLGNNTKLSYELEYAASASTQMSLDGVIDGILDITGPILPGAWAISSASKPFLQKTIGQVEKGMAKFLQNTRKSTVNDEFLPANDGIRGKSILLYTSDQRELAQIDLNVHLANSLLNSATLNVPSDYRQAVPQLDPHTNPLNALRVAWQGDSPALSQSLGDRVNALMTAEEPTSFRRECREVLNTLEGEFGLSKFDALNAMRHLLRNTLFTRNQDLYDSGCLAREELALLDQMGVALAFETPPRVDFQAFLYDDIGNFSRLPEQTSDAVKTRIAKAFADQVMVSNHTDLPIFTDADPTVRYTPQQMLEQLAELKTARFCCYGRPEKDGRELKNGVRMAIRPRDHEQLLQLEFYRGNQSPAFDYVLLRKLTEDEISPARQRRMMAPLADEGKKEEEVAAE